MTVINSEKIGDILKECAELYVLPRYKQLETHEISSKTGPRDLVTQADIDVEAHLERVLPDLLPGSIVVGEEGVSRGDKTLDVLSDDTQKVWVVDPVDGTYNFVHSRREFGIMLACVIGGEVQHGWIYDVLGGEVAIAEKGSGSYFGGVRLAVDKGARATDRMVGHINPRYFPKKHQEHIKQAMERFKRCESLHCAAHEYLRIAQGAAHFSIYSRLKAWDHLPGVLIVQEAGGYVAKWDAEPYTAQDHHCGLIVSSGEEEWNNAYQIFLKDIL